MFSSTPSMSSSAGGAFGSPFLFGPPTGFPSPFSTPATSSSPFSFRGFTPFSKGSRVTSYTKTTEFDRGERKMLVSISAMPAYSDKSHEELRWEDHHQFDTAGLGGGVVPAFARNCSTGLSPIFPSVRSNPFATTVTTPSIGQSPFLNPIPLSDPTVYRGPLPPSVPSNPFPTTVTPPTIGQAPFLNHVKPNLESVLDKMEEWEKSTQLICKDVKCVQEDMKSWIERDRSVELEKIEATQTVNQLREELAHVTRSKEAIIAEYLASPAFTKRLDEEHEKRLSKILHPCYVKALGEVQTKFPEIKPFTSQRPATASVSSYTSAFGSRVGFGQSINSNVSSTASSGSQYTFGQASNLFGSAPNSGGTSTGLFGGSSFGQSNNLFWSAPNYGGTSMGVFGGSSFGHSNLFGSAPNNGGTSTGVFGKSSFGQSSNLFGSSPNNSGTSTGAFGGSSFGQSSSVFGSVPTNGGTSTSVFGQHNPGSSFGQSSNLFGSVHNDVPPSIPSSPFATTATTPSSGQSPLLNPIPLSDPTVYRGPLPPSVPSNPFATTVTPPTIGQSSFMNHVKPNLESILDKMEEWEKSTQLICKDVKCVQEDMKSWIERERSVELEKIEATQTINQLREELAHGTRSKEAVIAEYLASPAFTKRLDEEHEKRLSKIFHPCYVKALGEVQTKFPEMKPFTSQSPATGWFPPSPITTPF